MPLRPANLVHTDEAAPVETTTSPLETGTGGPGSLSSAVERHVHIVDVVGSIPTATTTLTALERRRLPTNGYVYFFLGSDTDRMKIGHAKDVEARFRAIQTGCSEELLFFGMIPAVDPPALERALHKRFAKDRLHGEWFTTSADIVEFVEAYGYTLEGARQWDEAGYEEPPPRLTPMLRL